MDVPEQSSPKSHRLGIQMPGKAFNVFLELSRHKDGWSRQGLARDCGVPDRSIRRYLDFLEEFGWVYHTPNGKYFVNPAARIPAGAADHDGIDKILDKFVGRTERDVALATLDGPDLKITHLRKHRQVESLLERVSPKAVHATAAGKCLLRQLPDAERRRLLILNRMPRYTDKTITDARKLERKLEPAADMVWSAEGEYCETGACLAILAHPGATYGDAIALTTSVTTAEFEEAREKLVFNLYFTLAELQPVLGPLLPPTSGRTSA